MKTFVFDTETTGLIGNSVRQLDQQPHIIEFFGHLIDEKDELIKAMGFRANPGIPLEPIITRITGIRDEDLKDQKSFSAFKGDLVSLIEEADAVVAHNLSYDMAMVDMEMKRLDYIVEWPVIRICTVEATEWFKGHRLNLAALHEHLFSEPFKDAHSAKGDVAALTRCFCELRKRGEI